MLYKLTFLCDRISETEPSGRGATRAADRAEVAALLAAENVELLTQEEADRLTQLDAFTVRNYLRCEKKKDVIGCYYIPNRQKLTYLCI